MEHQQEARFSRSAAYTVATQAHSAIWGWSSTSLTYILLTGKYSTLNNEVRKLIHFKVKVRMSYQLASMKLTEAFTIIKEGDRLSTQGSSCATNIQDSTHLSLSMDTSGCSLGSRSNADVFQGTASLCLDINADRLGCLLIGE